MSDEIEAHVAAVTGTRATSDWITVDQPMIQAFADATHDWAFMHVDDAQAKAAGLGGTIAHGFLTLSLLAPMRGSAGLPAFPAYRVALNYGLDRVRMLSPVPAGSRVRGHFTIAAIDRTGPDRWRETMAVSVEIEGHERPALAANWLSVFLM